jgi:hypothetical protein
MEYSSVPERAEPDLKPLRGAGDFVPQGILCVDPQEDSKGHDRRESLKAVCADPRQPCPRLVQVIIPTHSGSSSLSYTLN